MVRSVGAATETDAPVERVWAVLKDVAAYPTWSPFIVSVQTDFALGSPVDMRVCLRRRRRKERLDTRPKAGLGLGNRARRNVTARCRRELRHGFATTARCVGSK
jgi:hypothetical protein